MSPGTMLTQCHTSQVSSAKGFFLKGSEWTQKRSDMGYGLLWPHGTWPCGLGQVIKQLSRAVRVGETTQVGIQKNGRQVGGKKEGSWGMARPGHFPGVHLESKRKTSQSLRTLGAEVDSSLGW